MYAQSFSQMLVLRVCNGGFALLMIIVVVFFLIYGVEVYFKVRTAGKTEKSFRIHMYITIGTHSHTHTHARTHARAHARARARTHTHVRTHACTHTHNTTPERMINIHYYYYRWVGADD